MRGRRGQKSTSRRAFLRQNSGALSALFVKSLASGIPVGYLMRPSITRAQFIEGIPVEATMEAAGASMARALGHSDALVSERIQNSVVVESFLA